MYQKDALLKVAEKRHEVSADPWSVGGERWGAPGLGVPVQQKPTLGR